MLTLALDTSTERGSVAVWDGAALVLAEDFVADRRHSSVLFSILERAQAAGEFGLIAAGLGPGSYAGVRIAIAAALGLSLANGARLAGLPSVLGLAEGRYAVAGDARRGMFYWSVVEDGVCMEGPLLADEAGLRASLARTDLPLFASETVPGLATELRFPDARRLARLAAAGRGIAATDDLEPIYLREPHITLPAAVTGPPRLSR